MLLCMFGFFCNESEKHVLQLHRTLAVFKKTLQVKSDMPVAKKGRVILKSLIVNVIKPMAGEIFPTPFLYNALITDNLRFYLLPDTGQGRNWNISFCYHNRYINFDFSLL